jgi:hypothetical protein
MDAYLCASRSLDELTTLALIYSGMALFLILTLDALLEPV